MRKIHTKLLAFLLSLFILLIPATANVFAMSAGALTFNTNEGYEVIIDDQAGYLTDEQKTSLSQVMAEAGKYGNVVFVTTEDHSSSSTENFCVQYFESRYGTMSSGVVFAVDMDLHNIYLISEGNFRKSLSNSRCTSITDNTYIYATEAYGRDFYTCAYKTFEQINKALTGKIIFTPMRFICAALLAIVLAMIINYFRAKKYSTPSKAADSEVVSNIISQVNINNPHAVKIGSDRTYSPRSSSSSSGGGGGGRLGGGGGGHSGGGHSI